MNPQARRRPLQQQRQQRHQPLPKLNPEFLADDLAEQVALHFVNPKVMEDDPPNELQQYLDSAEKFPPLLHRKDYLSKKSLSSKLKGLPSFLRAAQNQYQAVVQCLNLPE